MRNTTLLLGAFLLMYLLTWPARAATTISASPNPVPTGATVTIQVTNTSGDKGAWVSIEPANSHDGSFQGYPWAYIANNGQSLPSAGVTCAAPCTVKLTAPAAGSYEARCYPDNGLTVAQGCRAALTVTAPTQGGGGGVSSIMCTGTVSCPQGTGAVTIVGSSVPGPAGPPGPAGAVGPAGPAGPQGPTGSMARGTPTKGSTCKDGDSLYDYDSETVPTKMNIWTCSPAGNWWQTSMPITVNPW